MKKNFSNFKKKVLHFLVFISCYFNLPSFCAFLIKISLFKPKFLRKNRKFILYLKILLNPLKFYQKKTGIRNLKIIGMYLKMTRKRS